MGVFNDENAAQKEDKVIMSMHERAMCLMALSCVDDVVFNAPLQVTRELIISMNVSAVVCGKTQLGRQDPVAEDLGILRRIDSKASLTVEMIAERVCIRRLQYIDRNEVCTQKERDYWDRKQYVPEA